MIQHHSQGLKASASLFHLFEKYLLKLELGGKDRDLRGHLVQIPSLTQDNSEMKENEVTFPCQITGQRQLGWVEPSSPDF